MSIGVDNTKGSHKGLRDVLISSDLSKMASIMSDMEIGKKFGVTPDAVRYWRNNLNIPCVNRTRNPYIHRKRKYTINHNFFAEIDASIKAYILGFIAADGCIHKGRKELFIELHPKDIPILETIRGHLGSNVPIVRKMTKTGFVKSWESASVRFCSSFLVRDLAGYGIVHNKTMSLAYPIIPRSFDRDFIRGVFDGDGNISKWSFCFLGTSDMLDSIESIIERETSIKLRRTRPSNFERLTGYRKDRDVMVWLYTDSTIHLQRKMDIFTQYWQDISRFRGASLRPGDKTLLVEPSTHS